MQKPMVSWQATQKSVTPMGERARPRARLLGWRESYGKTNGLVASDPEICHSHGGPRRAPSEHFLDFSVRVAPRPPCAVIFCSLLTPLETYQHSLLGNIGFSMFFAFRRLYGGVLGGVLGHLELSWEHMGAVLGTCLASVAF